jgi:hypothetical protein
MTNFNQVKFEDSKEAAEFIVAAHKDGQTLTVNNGDEYSSPHMHSHDEYEVAQRDGGTYGVRKLSNSYIYPTPEGTYVIHSD